MITLLCIGLALAMDYLFKEPSRYHPLVGFGKWACWLESHLNRGTNKRWRGLLAWGSSVISVLIPFALLFPLVKPYPILEVLLGGSVLYLCVGWQSLLSHAQAVQIPLEQGNIAEARVAVSMMVSRDTQTISPAEIAAASTESVLENGADAIFSALFWFILFGPIGALIYRLSNTLDAMWGYKNTRFYDFGWAAARIDDGLNFIPARLTALSYVLSGRAKTALMAWKTQGHLWKSPNAGPVMAAGAGAINAKLGGGAIYHGQWQERPLLGCASADAPSAKTIASACRLINRALLLWVSGIAILTLIQVWISP